MRWRPGLKVGTGRGPKPPKYPKWDEFIQIAREAAAEKLPRMRRSRPMPRGYKVANPIGPPPEDRRCDYRFYAPGNPDRDGLQCRRWATPGTPRCTSHGGIRINPRSNAAVNMVLSGYLDAKDRQIQRERNPSYRFAANQVRKALDALGIERTLGVVKEGIDAYLEDDGGRAWRRWIDNMKGGAK
jgi:hypothetical protein